jgi:hypothetical protein
MASRWRTRQRRPGSRLARRAVDWLVSAPPVWRVWRGSAGDRDTRRQPPELVALIEGLALGRPRSSIAHIHRQAVRVAGERGWPAPSYGTVRSIVVSLDPGLVALAHDAGGLPRPLRAGLSTRGRGS